ncbi:MAG: hypothetical protein GXX94_09060 [Chloroflexi bacterium]|nr:hypothetical protein [Chloroflexota bacterium]
MTGWERARLSDVLGQRVIYRNLAPQDPGLPGLRDLWSQAGLASYLIPRKTSVEYARTVWLILEHAQRARGEPQPLERVLLIGDSARNDGGVARNMALERPSRAFIGTEDRTLPPSARIDGDQMSANRWSALSEMLRWLECSAFRCDESTAVLVDLDKTLIGARGRNDPIIDLARVRAAERTASGALGATFDVEGFRRLYARLIRPECHWITEDNQDYVAYLCVMVVGDVFPEPSFWTALETREISSLMVFCDRCEDRADRMSSGLLRAHREVRAGLLSQDPTPFKSFRNDEFLETIALMDLLPDTSTPEEVLASEIAITAEVLEVCRLLAARGALVFGLSDKPDEASLPTAKLAERGYRPIHDTVMKVHGERIY